MGMRFLDSLTRSRGRVAILIGTIAFSTGCGLTIEGIPQPGATPVNLDQLRTGPFHTDPVAYEPEASTNGREWLSLHEGRRLLGLKIHPMDIDSDLTSTGAAEIFSYDLYKSRFVDDFSEGHRDVLKANLRFVTAVTASNSNDSLREPKKIDSGIFQFETVSDAEAAVQGFHSASLSAGGRGEYQLNNSDSTYASLQGSDTIDVWRAHGIYVIFARVKITNADAAQLAALAAKTLDKQGVLLDSEPPAPMDEVLDQPLDPENLMRRAMIREVGSTLEFEQYSGLLQPSGMLHYERDPAGARTAYEKAGVDLIARRATTVYRTKDLKSAFQLQTFLAKPGKYDSELDPPPGIADAQCLLLDKPDPSRGYNLLCAVVFDRYVAVVTEKFLNTTATVNHALNERTSAQYTILKKCG